MAFNIINVSYFHHFSINVYNFLLLQVMLLWKFLKNVSSYVSVSPEKYAQEWNCLITYSKCLALPDIDILFAKVVIYTYQQLIKFITFVLILAVFWYFQFFFFFNIFCGCRGRWIVPKIGNGGDHTRQTYLMPQNTYQWLKW